MIAVFRVDASTQIGSGHVMRCLTLAQKLKKEKQADVYFVMRLLEGNLINLVKDKGFTVLTLPETPVNNDLRGYAKWLTVSQNQDADDTIDAIKELQDINLLIVDSYAIDYIWEQFVTNELDTESQNILKDCLEIQKAMAHKPFNPDSEAYRKFILQTLLKIDRLNEKMTFFDYSKERNILKTKLK